MELTGKKKTLHILFRTAVFLSFTMTVAVFFALIFLIALSEADNAGYAEWRSLASTTVVMYYVLLVLGVTTIVFSIICNKCGSVAAVVVRTIFLAAAFGINCTGLSLFNNIRIFSKLMTGGKYFELYSYTYGYFYSDQAVVALVFEMIALIIAGIIYFVLSITSIVALAKKPANKNNYYYNAYGYNNGYNNQYNRYNNQNNGYNNQNNGYNNQYNSYNGTNNGYNSQYGNPYNNRQGMNQNPYMNQNMYYNQNPNRNMNGAMNQNPNMNQNMYYNQNPNMNMNGAMNQNPNMNMNGAMNQNPNMNMNGSMNQNPDVNPNENINQDDSFVKSENDNVNTEVQQDSNLENTSLNNDSLDDDK